MNEMNKEDQNQFRNQLAALADPYRKASTGDEALFLRAMEEADHWHREQNPAYASIWEDHRPLMPLDLFRQAPLHTLRDAAHDHCPDCSAPGADRMPPVWIDTLSRQRIQRASLAIMRHHGVFSEQPANFLLLAPDPRKSRHAGSGEVFLRLTDCAPVRELHFAVDGEMRLDADLAWKLLGLWAKRDETVFLFGLSVFFEQLCLSGNKVLDFQARLCGLSSGACTSPDWATKRGAVLAGLETRLRGRHVQFRDLYGMNEHPLHYVSCQEGNFHLPLFSRFMVMGADGHARSQGRVGLVRLQNPFFASLPAHDLLTEDLALWGEDCPCGEVLPFFHFLGRLNQKETCCSCGG